MVVSILQQICRDLRMRQNAVVGHFRVGDVGAERCGHVARGAVGMIGVMFGGESCAVTGQALRAVKRNAFLGRDRAMRIVAAEAGHRVP